MSTHDVDVAVRYTLSTVDRGVRQAVSLSQNLTRETRSAQKELDSALRANSAAWKDTARVAASAQRQVTEAASRASSQVDKSLVREIESLRKAGVGYKEISTAAKGWGASAEQASAAIKRSADTEVKEIDRIVAARNKLRRTVGLSASTSAVAGHTAGRAGAGANERGFEHGAVRAAAGHLRSGVSFLGAGLVGGLVGYAGVEGVKQAVDSTKDLALQTRTLSAVTGMDSKTASEWVAITQARDIKTRTFAMTLKTLSTQTEGATSGSKKSVQAFKDLGITTDDLKKHSGDLSSLLGLVADHLNKMPGGAEKTAIASQLLGRNWTALQPVLLEGSKGMADQRKEAAALGVTLGGNAAENAKKLEEASVSLKIAQEGLEVQFAEHVAPAMIKVTEGGIKLFGVLRQDLGPAFHTVTGEVKDVSHWLEEHKTVLHAVEVALAVAAGGYATLKVAAGGIRFIRGLSADFVATKNAVTGLAHPIQALKGLFGQQETESQALMRSQTALAEANERLAKSFDQVAASSRRAAPGEALGAEAGLAGGAPILVPGKGAIREEKTLTREAGIADAGSAGMSESQLAQDGVLGALLGQQGVATIRQNLTSVLGTAGKGLLFGFFGNQLGQLGGGIVAGKKGASVGQEAGTGAGVGFALGGPLGAAAGAGIGGLAALTGGDDQTASGAAKAATKKFAQQIIDAANRGDVKELETLSSNAKKLGASWETARAAFGKLSQAASHAAQNLQLQSAGKAVTGIESSIAGSKYAPNVSQIAGATVSQLKGLGSQAQKAGADAIVKFTSGMESQKRLPVGSTNRLIAQLERSYGPSFTAYLTKAGENSQAALVNERARKNVISKVQDQVDQMSKQWGLLVPDVTVTSKNIEQVMTSNIEAMRNKVLNTSGQEQKDAISHLNALLGLYAKYSPLIAAAGASSFTAMSKTVTSTLKGLSGVIGGSLGGWATMIADFAQAVTPALSSIVGAVSSGAAETPSGAQRALGNAVAIGGKALLNLVSPHHGQEGGYFHGVVPGDHTRDGTLAWLSGREFVMTGDGQAMMDSYAPGLLDHIAASQAPHFAAGGRVFKGAVSEFGPPLDSAGSTAYGGTDAAPGIAINPGPGTGDWDGALAKSLAHKWFQVSVGGHTAPLQVIDKGPSARATSGPDAGQVRRIDITGAGWGKMGISGNYPTDAIGTAVELVGGQHGKPATGAANKGIKESIPANTKVTFSPAGPGLGDGYYQGYEYGLDPTTGVGGPAALKAAILGSQLKATTMAAPSPTKFTLPKIPTLGNVGSLPKGLQGKGKLAALDQSMTAVARHFLGHPYDAGGGPGDGRPPNLGANALDCSAYVSAIINLGGRGILPPVPSGWTTDQLKTWGVPNDGKYITVGVRGTSGSDAHTMIESFGKFWESSHPGKGPHQDTTWSEDFPIRRHPPGLRGGGRIPRFAKGGKVAPGGSPLNDAGWWYRQQGIKPQAKGKAGTFMAPQHGTVDDRWRHRRRYARGGFVGAGAAGTFLPPQPVLPPSLTYQPVMAIAQPVAPPAASFYGTHTAAGEPRALRRETSSISAAGTNQQAAHALSQLSKTVDNVKKVAYTSLLSEAKELQKAAASATKSGDKQQATRLKQAYQLVTNEAGRRVGALVKAATDEGSALTAANQRLQNMLTRNQIDPASAQGTAFIAKFQDQSVKVIKNEVSKLQKAYELAKKAGNQRAAADAGSKLQQALSDLDDATAAAVQDHVDQVNAAKQAVADAAQSTVDTATHDVTMASSGETALEDRQQLAGTSGTAAGAQQLSDYINQSVVPAMQKQVAALQAQEGVAQQQGNTTLAQQIAEQIADAQNGILQSQLDAQQAIQAATQATAENTQQLVGNLGVSYNNGSYADIAGALNGV